MRRRPRTRTACPLRRATLDADPVATARAPGPAADRPSAERSPPASEWSGTCAPPGAVAKARTVDRPARRPALATAGMAGTATNRPAGLAGCTAAWSAPGAAG
nr:hypothetical protein KitaXyl93_03090 [Kitasatospora sp. Xyl93]